MLNLPEAHRHALFSRTNPISVVGAVGSPEQPILFLLDENHELAAVIDSNIRTANALSERSLIELIGIEDIPADRDFFPSPAAPDTQFTFLPPQARIAGRFERAMRSGTATVVGIDSPRLIERIRTDVEEGLATVASHPGQRERSLHFVRSMLWERQSRGSAGNCLISCGTDHNTHIMDIASDPTQQPVWWPDWCFIRIRSDMHP